MSNKTIVKSEMFINAPASRVWAFLSAPARLARLFSPSAKAEFAEQNGEEIGYLALGELRFDLKKVPYDLLLQSKACTIVLRLNPTANGRTEAVMAASCLNDSGFIVRERDLFNTLSRLRSVTALPESELPPEPAAEPVAEQAAEQPQKSKKERAPREKKPVTFKGILKVAAGFLAVVAIAAAGVFVVPRITVMLNNAKDTAAAPAAEDLSAKVGYDAALSLALGAGEKEVSAHFGTDGIELDENRTVYRSKAQTEDGLPLEQVCVEYSGGKAVRVTYLNLQHCRAVGEITDPYINVGTGDPAAIAEKVGASVSMIRRYAAEEGELSELHFGFVDPYANFDPAWSGQLVFTVDTAANLVSSEYTVPYDGGDPLVVGALEGTSLALQYDSYSEYLHDKHQLDRALCLNAGFSRGDARRIFGEMTEYDAGSGVKVWQIDSEELLADGTTPAYRYSFGFYDNGAFNMASYVNMRLMNKTGVLPQTRCSAITYNMSYNEVRTLAGILPTAVYVNENYLILGYGAYVGGAVTEEQFELVVKIDRDTMYAAGVYNNSEQSAAEKE